MSKTENNKYILKLAAILFAICFIATLLLTLCNHLTKDRIAQLATQTENLARQEVIPGAEFELIKTSDYADELSAYSFVEAYKATNDGDFSGYCISVAPQGFNGPVSMIVGVKEDGSYYGVKITSLSETPGLGAKAQEEDFYGQFSQGKTGVLEVVKNNPNPSESEISAISGATITSKAVTSGVNDALEIAKILNEKEAE